jgi:hypothetical protein
LKGLQPDGSCPECGQSIAESSPALRVGPGNGGRVVIDVLRRPKVFFRTLRVDGSNVPARGFMWLIVLLIGLLWLIGGTAWGDRSLEVALFEAGLAMASLYLLSYIEAVGVVYFSRKRSWRVPFRLAERLVCYTSVGWIPAAIVVGWALGRFQDGSLDRWMRQLLGTWGTWQSVELLVLIGAVAMMWFEVLVWLGVRQTRYANSATPSQVVLTEGEPSRAH